MTADHLAPGARAYGLTALLVLLADCPGLINAVALNLASPTIATDVGVSTADTSWVTILGNGAYALGAVLAADLMQRVDSRRLLLWCLGAFALGSLLAAIAPTLPILVVARILQGGAAGVLLLATVAPLITEFPARYRPRSIAVLNIALFGAITAGPLVGGLVEQADAWRLLFVIDGLVGVAALLLVPRLVAARPAPHPHLRVDAAALTLCTIGVAGVVVGLGELTWHDYGAVAVWAPLTIGILALLAVVPAELLQRAPLMPLREIAHLQPLAGIIFSTIAGIAFVGMMELLAAFLEGVRGLGAWDAGVLFWPGVVAAFLAALVVGLAASRPQGPWLPMALIGGMACLAGGAWWLTGLTATTGDGTILTVVALLGLAAGLTVAPGMFVAAFGVPSDVVARAFALVTLVRLAGAFVVVVPLAHAVGTNATIHYTDLATQAGRQQMTVGAPIMRLTRVVAQQGASPGQAHTVALRTLGQMLQRQALVLGLRDVFGAVLWITLAGTLTALLLIALGKRRQSHPVPHAQPTGLAPTTGEGAAIVPA